MLSFNNDPALKALHVAQAEHHFAADMLLAGTYGENDDGAFKGCSVGCFAHDIDPKADDYHATVASARFLPEWLIQLQDAIFEGLSETDRKAFHVEIAKRIPRGVDLEKVQYVIAVSRFDRLIKLQNAALEANHGSGVHDAIEQAVAALVIERRRNEAMAAGNTCDVSAAQKSWSAARSAAQSAWAGEPAWSAAESEAVQAAWSAARSAEWSAWSAAAESESAESGSAEWSAWSAAQSAG